MASRYDRRRATRCPCSLRTYSRALGRNPSDSVPRYDHCMSVPSVGSPFAEAAAFYEFRAPYAAQALGYVREVFQLDGASRALDLGCGPGTLTIPLARIVGHVHAIDASEAMLNEGRRRATQANIGNIDWLCMHAEEITEAFGTFDVVTMGQSFHWMDRDAVLRRLAPMTVSNGGLALIGPGRRRPQESWETLANEVISRYIDHHARHQQMNPEPGNQPALLRSGTYSQFSVREFSMELERDVPSVIGYIYSMSTSPPSAFGDRAALFERDLTRALLRSNPSGVFKETIETEVLIAHKIGQ
jgi:SAM-dependent methyltransferase